jgi:hypothetical protein
MHSIHGATNDMQSVADDQHGLIVHVQAVSHHTSDVNQFAEQIKQAK